MLFGLPRDCSASNMFVQNGVNNCPAIIRNLVFKFMLRVDKSDNLIICSVLNSTWNGSQGLESIGWNYYILLHIHQEGVLWL